MSDAIVRPDILQDDDNDFSLRPQFLNEFLGQQKIKENLHVFIEAAKTRNESLDHLFLIGPPGLGKTTLAQITAHELGADFKVTSAPALDKPKDLAGILSTITEKTVFFIDEIHRLKPAIEEMLYIAMEDYELDWVIGQGVAARTVRIPIPKFTLVGATTKAGMVSGPLITRFGIVQRFSFYETEELAKIIKRSANILNVEIDDDAAFLMAKCSRGTPRVSLTSSRDAIIFIDEIHTIVGAGSSQGSLDVANILKPALSRGEIQVIGATTLDEYRTNIESDAALERRFQRVVIEPTSEQTTLEILRHVAPLYAEHHSVEYSDEALTACVKLSARYINDRHFPDKAIDILDQVGASVQLSDKKPSAQIGADAVERVVASLVGVPAERISSDEQQRLGSLADHLSERVVGQQQAIERLTQAIIRSRVGIADSSRPIGVFMFVGPTGVGKTLLAKELSKWLFAERRGLIRLDMSEYSEKHNISRLIGSPPGYVGYGEGGELSEAVRQRPYSVILLDEIEKAHPEVFNIMLQIFDEGHLTDGSARRIDFRNTIIIMTSNVGARKVKQTRATIGYSNQDLAEREQLSHSEEYRKALERTFAPEFLGRIDDILQFNKLSLKDIERIVEIELLKLSTRINELGYTLRITDSAKQALAKIGYSQEYGARTLRRIISEKIETPLSQLIVEGSATLGSTIVVEKQPSKCDVKLRVQMANIA